MSINERLRLVIDSQKMSIKAFAEEMDIPLRTLHNYLSGAREPSTASLIKISQSINIDLNWLILGFGDMSINREQDNNLSKDEMVLLKNYRKADMRSQNAIQSALDVLSNND